MCVDRDCLQKAERLLQNVEDFLDSNDNNTMAEKGAIASNYARCSEAISLVIWSSVCKHVKYKPSKGNPAKMIFMAKGNCASTGLSHDLEEAILNEYRAGGDIDNDATHGTATIAGVPAKHQSVSAVRRQYRLALKVLEEAATKV